MPHRSPAGVTYGIDLVALIKGAAAGFAVLVLGGLAAAPLAAVLSPVVWAIVVNAAAFALAGAWIGDATVPPVHGVVAALAAYLLVLPLIFALGVPVAWWQIPVAAVIAAATGALAGFVAGRRRGPVF
ncbi:hypothetical protein [Pseudonocardia sp.]|uniref:hypothetical protein n=1 Tax=Pseudonocardia sp. TaxID=60912 RepID=UPI003D13BD70